MKFVKKLFYLFITLLLVASCKNSDLDSTDQKYFTISLDTSKAFPEVSSQDRTALPEIPVNIIYRITASSVTEGIVYFYSTNDSAIITLHAGKWFISAEGFKGTVESDCSDSTKVLQSDSPQSVDESNTSVTITMKSWSNNNCYGTVSLPLKVYDNSVIKQCKVVCTELSFSQILNFDSNTTTLDLDSSKKIQPGVYEFYFTFLNASGETAFYCSESVNIYSNLETTVWKNNGSTPYIINSGSSSVLCISEELVKSFSKDKTVYYVVNDSSTVDSVNTGHTYFDPIKFSDAVKKIKPENGYTYTFILEEDIVQNPSAILLDNTMLSLDLSSAAEVYNITFKSAGTSSFKLDAGCSATYYGRVASVAGNSANVPEITFKNIIMTGGYMPDAKGFGGALFSSNANIILQSCEVNNNSCYYSAGGAIMIDKGKGSLTASNTIFDSNTVSNLTTGNGGAIFSHRPVTLNGCSFTANKALFTGAISTNLNGIGGAVVISGADEENVTLEITDCFFQDNVASNGYGNDIASFMGVSAQHNGRIVLNSSTFMEYDEETPKNGSSSIYLASSASSKFVLEIDGSDYYTTSDFFAETTTSQQINIKSPFAMTDEKVFWFKPYSFAGTEVFVTGDLSSRSKIGIITSSGSSSEYYVTSTGTVAKDGGITDPEPSIVVTDMTNMNSLNPADYDSSKSLSGSYYIAGSQGLKNFAEIVKNGANTAGVEINIANNMSISSWTPVGTMDYPFKGKVQGNDFEISGINITSSEENAGFFGYVDNAEIFNLKLSGSVTGTKHVGGLIGSVTTGSITIKNCTVNMNVTASGENAGGFIGNAQTGTVGLTNCINLGNVTAEKNAGGIIGYANGTSNTVINCANIGEIKTTSSTELYVGGIVGYGATNQMIIQNCYNKGNVFHDSTKGPGIAFFGVTGFTLGNTYYLKDAASCSFDSMGTETSKNDLNIPFEISGTTCKFPDKLYGNIEDLVEALNRFLSSGSPGYFTWKYDDNTGSVTYGLPVFDR